MPNWRCIEKTCGRIYQSRHQLTRHEKSAHLNSVFDQYSDSDRRTPSDPGHAQTLDSDFEYEQPASHLPILFGREPERSATVFNDHAHYDSFTNLDTITDLSGRVSLSSYKPVFNGSYSSVYHGKLGNELVAVKVLKEIYGAKPQTMHRKLQRERTVWARLRHRNVLPLYGFAKDHELFEPFGGFISPWRTKGNACEFLKTHGNSMSKDERLGLWKGVVAGVAYLHNLEPVLVHGDLKSANVLIDDDGTPQICDFGLISIILEEETSGMTTTSPFTGTDRYLAYELLHDREQILPTISSDIFALGCIGLEFYFLQLPHAKRKNNLRGQIFADIKAGRPPATKPISSSAQDIQIWDLLDSCWMREPEKRPSAQAILACLDYSPHTMRF